MSPQNARQFHLGFNAGMKPNSPMPYIPHAFQKSESLLERLDAALFSAGSSAKVDRLNQNKMEVSLLGDIADMALARKPCAALGLEIIP